MSTKKKSVPPAAPRQFDIDLDALWSSRSGLMKSLEDRIERFCDSAPMEDLNVVFHSTGINYAHQFYVLSLFGKERLSQFGNVHFISGSVIAAIVFYSYHTDNLQFGQGDGRLWERIFFAAHGISPVKAVLRLPFGMVRGLPVLSSQVQIDVIKKGIGVDFGECPMSILPENFKFWLYDTNRDQLMCATAHNGLNFIKLAELAVAATAVPGLLRPFEIEDYCFIDPVFSPGRGNLRTRIREISGPTLVSNMLKERVGSPTTLLRPHVHANGNALMARELLQFCLGISNEDHVAGLEIGLVKLNEERG